jgi:hypothetical protein
MKKFLRLLTLGMAAAALVMVVSACSSTPKEGTATGNDTAVTQAATTEEAKPAETSANTDAGSNAMVTVVSTKLMKDNGSGAAGDEVKAFKAADHKQYFDVQLSDFLKAGTEVKWVFTAVDTTAGKDIKITEVNTTVVIGNKLTAFLTLDKDFPTGTYRGDILIDGKPLGSIDYTVE